MDKEKLLNKALNLSYFFLKFRPRTKKEIFDYLQKKSEKHGFNNEVIHDVIKSLEEEKLIDDGKFIELFIKGRISKKPKSPWVLKHELRRYGIPENLIDQYFSVNGLNEEELAYSALQKNWNKFKNITKTEKFKKVINFLMRRGFSFSQAKQAYEKQEET